MNKKKSLVSGKVQSMHTSRYVLLPKRWVEENKIKSGDVVNYDTTKEGYLIVIPTGDSLETAQA